MCLFLSIYFWLKIMKNGDIRKWKYTKRTLPREHAYFISLVSAKHELCFHLHSSHLALSLYEIRHVFSIRSIKPISSNLNPTHFSEFFVLAFIHSCVSSSVCLSRDTYVYSLRLLGYGFYKARSELQSLPRAGGPLRPPAGLSHPARVQHDRRCQSSRPMLRCFEAFPFARAAGW